LKTVHASMRGGCKRDQLGGAVKLTEGRNKLYSEVEGGGRGRKKSETSSGRKI